MSEKDLFAERRHSEANLDNGRRMMDMVTRCDNALDRLRNQVVSMDRDTAHVNSRDMDHT